MAEQSEQSAPRRSGPAWWVWALAGCGGCAVLLGILAAVGGVFLVKRFQEADVGVVTQTQIQQRLADVPLYPRGTFDAERTRRTLQSLRFAGGLMGDRVRYAPQHAGVVVTSDPSAQVFRYYDEVLKKGGWQPQGSTPKPGGGQQFYQKGNELAGVQVQAIPGSDRLAVVVMRGGPEIAGTPRPAIE